MRVNHVSFQRRLAGVLAAVILFGCVGISRASFIVSDHAYLSDLIAGQTLFVTDKAFSNWGLTNLASGSGALLPDPTAIEVFAGIESTTGDHALRINLSLNAASGQTVNATIRYQVKILSQDYPGFYLHDVGLRTSGASAIGDGVVNVSEKIYDGPPSAIPNTTKLANLSVATDAVVDVDSDYKLFSPVQHIWVVKDISLSGGVAGTAHVSEIYQTFSQVPEPASLSLLAVGGMLLVQRRRRRAGA